MPWCTYTSPEVAHVGLYEKDAKETGHRGRDADRAALERSTAPSSTARTRASCASTSRRASDRILGATLVAEHAGDMIGELCLAVTHGIGLGKIAERHPPLPHPGRGGEEGRRHLAPRQADPRVKKLFARWFRVFK